MKVCELAQQLKTTSDSILNTLKALKLKAKDSQQELNGAVVSVIKSEFIKKNRVVLKKEAAPVAAPVSGESIEVKKAPARKRSPAPEKPAAGAESHGPA